MTREEIIRMAREVGLGAVLSHSGEELRIWIEGSDWHDEVERFAVLVAAAEREACAKVCESYIVRGIGTEMAVAIRARGEK